MLHLNNEEQLKIGNYIITAHEGDIIIESKDKKEEDYIFSIDTYKDFEDNMDTFRKYFEYNEFVKIVKWYFKMDDIVDLDNEEKSLKDRIMIIKMIRRQEIEDFISEYDDLKLDFFVSGYCRIFSFKGLVSAKILAEIEIKTGLELCNMARGHSKVVYEFQDEDWEE